MKAGWWFRPFLKSADLSENILVEFPWDDGLDLYESEEDARNAAREFFAEQRQQAILDIAFLAKPYVSPNGYMYICPDYLVEQWKSEARDQLRMTEAILSRLATAA